MKHIILLLGILFGFVSCQMLEGEQELNNKSDLGKLQLSVLTPDKPQSRAAGEINTDNFEVTITGEGNFTRIYTASQLATGVDLPIGEYNVQANTPGTLEKVMNHAYFLGSSVVSVQKNLTTQTEILCKQQNVMLKLNYGSEFINTYNSWSITIDDGAENVLIFDEQETNPAARYWLLGEGTTVLTVNLMAQQKDDNANIIKGRMTLRKADAEIVYDEDDEAYKGGDSVVINVTLDSEDVPGENPEETPEEHSGVLGINISSNLTFANTDETVKIPVIWESDPTEDTPEDQPGQGGNVTHEEPVIVFTAPSVEVVGGEGSELNATITADAGLKSVKVIAASEGDFQATLEDLENTGLCLLSGHELVGDELLPALFETLGADAAMPSEGDKTYVFNITNFYSLIAMYGPSTTTFSIVVTDMDGNVANGSVQVKIVE